jgi:hypothetical protein
MLSAAKDLRLPLHWLLHSIIAEPLAGPRSGVASIVQLVAKSSLSIGTTRLIDNTIVVAKIRRVK